VERLVKCDTKYTPSLAEATHEDVDILEENRTVYEKYLMCPTASSSDA
jgi:hypothetical protein